MISISSCQVFRCLLSFCIIKINNSCSNISRLFCASSSGTAVSDTRASIFPFSKTDRSGCLCGSAPAEDPALQSPASRSQIACFRVDIICLRIRHIGFKRLRRVDEFDVAPRRCNILIRLHIARELQTVRMRSKCDHPVFRILRHFLPDQRVSLFPPSAPVPAPGG